MASVTPNKAARLFLQNLDSNDTKSIIESLTQLAESLEAKNDPEVSEIQLVDNIYSFMEKLRLLESNAMKYITNGSIVRNLPGNKLSTLYEDIRTRSGSILRD